MTSIMEEALEAIALHARNHAFEMREAGELDGAASFGAIADMLEGMIERRDSALQVVAEGRKINGMGLAHQMQTQYACMLVAEGMRSQELDRATALKIAAEETGRTQKSLQNACGIPADREAFDRWYEADDQSWLRATTASMKTALTSHLGHAPSWDSFTSTVGTAARQAGQKSNDKDKLIEDIQRLFNRSAGVRFCAVRDALGAAPQARLSALIGGKALR